MTAHQARAECLLAWLARADDTGTHHAAHQYRKEERHHQESAKRNHECACRPIHDRFLANTLVGRSFTRMSVIQGMKAARNPTARTLSRMRSQIILAGSFTSSRMSMLPSDVVDTSSRRARV